MCKNVVPGKFRHWGSRSLTNEIQERIKSKIHCFGHIYEEQLYKYCDEDSATMFINAATNMTRKCFKFTFYIDLENH